MMRVSPRALKIACGGVFGGVGALSLAHCEAPVPAYTVGGSKYDQSVYQGRLMTILEMIDPRTLLIGDAEVAAAQALLKEFEEKGSLPNGVDDEAMWKAKQTVNAVIHPPTGEKMFILGRMSAFVPMNVPVALGMLFHGPTSIAAGLFWQWANQSYNVVNNYVNRGGTDIDTMALLQSYGLAVFASCSIALGSGKLMKAYPGLMKLGPFVPYIAVICAGTCNVGFTRMDEVQNGIVVCDADGTAYGKSIAAGQLAVFKTVTTRSCFLPIFPLLVPPAIMSMLPLVPATLPHTMVSLAVITASMAVALPMALAIEPGQMTLEASSLEPQFQNVKDSKGNPISTFYASKGL